ncbi:FG-GAP repeat domain-containing protein [Streptomyces sp. NPDC003327]
MRTALSRRRVAVSVGLVMAVVAAAPVLAPAATAAPASTTTTATTAPVPVPFLASGGALKGAGATGFLSVDADGKARWTRYADGVSTLIPTGAYETAYGSGPGSDTVVVARHAAHRHYTEYVTVYDMATGAAPVTVAMLGPTAPVSGFLVGAVGSTLVVDDDGRTSLADVARNGAVTVRQATGGPESQPGFDVADTLPGAALVGYSDYQGNGLGIAVVDLATAAYTEKYSRPLVGTYRPRLEILSSNRVLWTEHTDGKTVLASVVRGTQAVERTPLGPDDQAHLVGGVVGDWLAFGSVGPSDAPTPWHAFTARSLTDGTTVPLLDHATSVTKGSDGALLAFGTTAAHGKGVYRIALGADGRPAAELVASTGETNGGTTPLTYVGTNVPATLRLDGVARTRMSWRFSTTEADLDVEFTHKASSRRFTQSVRPATTGTGAFPDGSLGIDWAGVLGQYPGRIEEGALNGAYDWKVTARPWNGMPSVTATGTFEVTRTPKVHDYTDNGSPDLILRPADGYLDRVDTLWDDTAKRLVPARPGWAGSTGSGNWNAYDRIESAGDLAGSTAPDVISRDRSGVLWLHLGNKGGFIEQPRKVGVGWDGYNLFASGSDVTGDGRADLLAVDKNGALDLYRGTGYASMPFGRFRTIGVGWGIYNDITAVGNVAGAPAGDLVARDRAGVLWLYLGKGDGTFAPRIRIGGGRQAYGQIVGIGDANKDGRPDLYARTPGNTAYFYAGTGSWRAPFAPRAATEVGVARPGTTYSQVF